METTNIPLSIIQQSVIHRSIASYHFREIKLILIKTSIQINILLQGIYSYKYMNNYTSILI